MKILSDQQRSLDMAKAFADRHPSLPEPQCVVTSSLVPEFIWWSWTPKVDRVTVVKMVPGNWRKKSTSTGINWVLGVEGVTLRLENMEDLPTVDEPVKLPELPVVPATGQPITQEQINAS